MAGGTPKPPRGLVDRPVLRESHTRYSYPHEVYGAKSIHRVKKDRLNAIERLNKKLTKPFDNFESGFIHLRDCHIPMTMMVQS